jgi:hypothetical protein
MTSKTINAPNSGIIGIQQVVVDISKRRGDLETILMEVSERKDRYTKTNNDFKEVMMKTFKSV